MKLIQELLDLNPQQVTESGGKRDLYDLIDCYLDQEKMYNFEGGRGVNNFEKIIKILGYRNMDAFLEDNSGCLQKMLEWLMEQNIEEWKEAMQAELSVEGDNGNKEEVKESVDPKLEKSLKKLDDLIAQVNDILKGSPSANYKEMLDHLQKERTIILNKMST